MVARVEFRIEHERPADGDLVPTVMPYAGGRSLREHARRVELPQARRDGNAALAGKYLGLHAERVRWPGRHFLGEPAESWFGDGDTILLGCVCGDWGCWPLTARVEVDDALVRWTGFRHGHRDWDYGELPPFAFERRQYDEALRATAAAASPYR